jgi:hypothetical protein
MPNVELPDDLIAFLREGRRLEYDAQKCEAGRLTLVPLGKHALGEVWVNPKIHPLAERDPHAGENGYYAVPAVNLIADCEGYDPESLLLWLPGSHVYGTWDCDHWELRVFPRVTWTQIASSPLQYINAQWSLDTVENEMPVPWPTYPFRAGRPF